jgi:hypothetical protein
MSVINKTYLDLNGLTRYDEKIKDYIDAGKLTNTDSFYGTCSTAADTAAKVITLVDADNFSLRPGVTVTVKFSATNTAQNPTINVNGTGAKSVLYNKAAITTGSLWTAGTANRPMRYTYDGTYWVWMGQSIDNNTTYSAMSTAELTKGTATTQRTVRADYLKAGINSLIDTKIAGKADASDVTALAGRVTNVQVSATQPTGQVAGDIWIKLSRSGGNS